MAESEAMMREVARGGIERYAEWAEGASPDEIYHVAYPAALDALISGGVETETARRVADSVARDFANP